MLFDPGAGDGDGRTNASTPKSTRPPPSNCSKPTTKPANGSQQPHQQRCSATAGRGAPVHTAQRAAIRSDAAAAARAVATALAQPPNKRHVGARVRRTLQTVVTHSISRLFGHGAGSAQQRSDRQPEAGTKAKSRLIWR